MNLHIHVAPSISIHRLFCLGGNLPADIFFSKSVFFVVVVFVKKSVISVECQAVWIQIMPVGSDLGLNCLQR